MKLRDTAPLSPKNTLSAAEKSELRAALAARGVRLLPFPFANAATIVSDIDDADKAKFALYHGLIEDRLGLDFGDSFWLFQRVGPARKGGLRLAMGVAPFASDFGDSTILQQPIPGTTEPLDAELTTNAVVRYYHEGRLDHFHTFLSHGPKVQVLNPRTMGERTLLEPPRTEPERSSKSNFDRWVAGEALPALKSNFAQWMSGVVFRLNREEPLPARVTIETPFGALYWQGSLRSNVPVDFTAFTPSLRAVNYNDIDRIVVETEQHRPSLLERLWAGQRGKPAIARGFIIHATSGLLRDKLAELQHRFGMRASLITGHASFHFRAEHAKIQLDQRQQKTVKGLDLGSLSVSLVGEVKGESGETLLTTDADDPASVSRAMPDATEPMGVNLLIPCGFVHVRRDSLELLDLIRPARTRYGGGVYVAARVFPELSAAVRAERCQQVTKEWVEIRSNSETFPSRLETALQSMAGKRDLAAPVYTHLGIFSDGLHEKAVLQGAPYFDLEAPLARAMQEHFGIGPHGVRNRTWFIRASGLYEYVLSLMRTAAEATREGDRICLRTQRDPHTGTEWPRSPAQLFGLTFYVDRPERAVVELDGRELACLGRNPADESGRASVTILETGRCYYIDCIDDPHAGPARLLAGEVRTEVQRLNDAPERMLSPATSQPYSRIATLAAAASASAPAVLALDNNRWGLPASQALQLWARAAPGLAFGLRLVDRDGHALYVGDPRLSSARPAEACHLIDTESGAFADWHSICFAMTSLARAEPGAREVPPNRALATVELILAGPAGAALNVSGPRYLRPHGLPSDPRDGYCLGGSVASQAAGDAVRVERLDQAGEDCLVPIDASGLFCATNLACGHYRLRRVGSGAATPPLAAGEGGKPDEIVYLRTHRFDIEM